MTGNEVFALRTALGFEPSQFAQLLGVHPSTLYRWEAAAATEIRVEPFQQQVLAVLQRQVGTSPKSQAEDLGKAILSGLLIGGAMLGLFTLLEAVFSDDPERRNGGAIARGKRSRARSSPNKRRRSS